MAPSPAPSHLLMPPFPLSWTRCSFLTLPSFPSVLPLRPVLSSEASLVSRSEVHSPPPLALGGIFPLGTHPHLGEFVSRPSAWRAPRGWGCCSVEGGRTVDGVGGGSEPVAVFALDD